MRPIQKGLVLVAFLAVAGTATAAAPSIESFQPMAKGTQWVYDTLNKKKNEHFEMKVVMEGPWDDGMIMTQKDGRGKMREFLLTTVKGIFISKLGLSKSYTPEIFTRFSPPVPKVISPL